MSYYPKIRKKVPLSTMRAVIARHVTKGSATPSSTLFTSVDLTNSFATLRSLVTMWRSHKLRPQYQDLVVYSLAKALEKHPDANAHFVDDEVIIFDTVNIGIAVAIDGGIIVPVLRDAQSKSLFDISKEVKDIVRATKNGRLDSNNSSGSTFSITSLITYGVEFFTPILNSPEVAILGIGRVNKVGERRVGHFSLTFDHRVWDGVPVALFLAEFVDILSGLKVDALSATHPGV